MFLHASYTTSYIWQPPKKIEPSNPTKSQWQPLAFPPLLGLCFPPNHPVVSTDPWPSLAACAGPDGLLKASKTIGVNGHRSSRVNWSSSQAWAGGGMGYHKGPTTTTTKKYNKQQQQTITTNNNNKQQQTTTNNNNNKQQQTTTNNNKQQQHTNNNSNNNNNSWQQQQQQRQQQRQRQQQPIQMGIYSNINWDIMGMQL